MIDKDSLPLDKPRRTPDHPTKSHVVKTRVDGSEKIIRFGEQGASTAGKPKEGESEAMKQKRASFKARHAKNIAKGKSSPAYWADKVKWATGGSVELEDLDEKYEGIKKPDFKLLESFRELIRTLQERAEDSGTQEFDPVRALGRSGAAGSLEDLYEAYSDKPASHASRAEAGAKDPKRTETAKMVFDSFKNAGFSDAQAKALTAEINREGSFNPAYLYGSHTDAANKATNVGMLSWQGDRADRLMSFMADRGLIDPAGRITPGQAALNAQAEYLRSEMENDPSYAATRETFLANPDIDQETAHNILGKNFIRWRIDDPKYRGSGFDRISEGYDLLNMAQGFAEGGLAQLAHKYDKGGKKKDDDELERAKMERQLAEQMQGLYEEDLAARGNVPRARSEPQDPRLLNVGGLEERLALLNQTLNPVEAIGGAMRAGREMMDPEAGGYDRLAALGNMLSGVAGVAGPAAIAKRIGAPAATAVMESLLGASPTAEAVADMARKYAVDESGALRLYQGSPHDFAAERLVRMPDGSTQYIVGKPDVLPDVPAGAELLRDFPLGRQRMDKIGTGEGAQAYGYGLYGAEAEGVARGYRDQLSRPYLATSEGQNIAEKYGDDVANIFEMAGGEPDDMRATVVRLRQIVKENLDDIGVADVSQLKSEFYGDLPSTIIDFSNRADRLESMLNSGDVKLVNTGRMYELEVNANPEDFLDWDKPLSEQSQRVRNVLGQFGLKHDEAASNDFDNALLAALFDDAPGPLPKRPINPTGNDIYMRSTLRNFAVQDAAGKWGPGASTYDESLAAAGGDPKRVRAISTGSAPDRSEALRRAGIPGIRYLDAGSRGAGDGSRNYVIFDENLINIVRKYGIAGAAAMLGVSASEVAQAMEQGNVEELDQKYAEGGLAQLDQKYKRGGKKKEAYDSARAAAKEDKGLPYSELLIDNLIGLENKYLSAGERLGRAINEDPLGFLKSAGSAAYEGAKSAVTSPIETIQGVGDSIYGSGESLLRGLDGKTQELFGVGYDEATPDQITLAREALAGDVLNVSQLIPGAVVARRGIGAAGEAVADMGRKYAPVMYADAIGTARALASGDLEFIRGRGLPENSIGVGADVVRKPGERFIIRGSDYFDPAMGDAGRTRDPAMFSPFSSTKHTTAPNEFFVSGTDLGGLETPTIVSPSEIQKLYDRIYFATGDRTSNRRLIEEINDIILRDPTITFGGPEYMDQLRAWASDPNAMTAKANAFKELPDDVRALLAYMPMGERSGDFSDHMAQTYGAATKTQMGGNMAPALREISKIDRLIAEKFPNLKDVPSVASEEFPMWLSSLKGGQKAKIVKAFDQADFKSLGMPDVSAVRFAITNPDLVKSDALSIGYRMSEPDASKGIIRSAEHPSYGSYLPIAEGTTNMSLGYELPWWIGARDTALPKIAPGGPTYALPKDIKSYMGNPQLYQNVDDQWVEEASTYGDLLASEGKQAANDYALKLLEQSWKSR